jgi:hypothetical protein
LDLRRQGLSVSAIARQLERDRKTVRKYIERGLEAPAYGPPGRIRPWRRRSHRICVKRIAAFPELAGRRLLREIREPGFRYLHCVKRWESYALIRAKRRISGFGRRQTARLRSAFARGNGEFPLLNQFKDAILSRNRWESGESRMS